LETARQVSSAATPLTLSAAHSMAMALTRIGSQKRRHLLRASRDACEAEVEAEMKHIICCRAWVGAVGF
jgi:hypothetical protein